MMKTTAMLAVLGLLAMACVGGPAGSGGNPLNGLERLKNFETRRDSSSDANWQNGNHDSVPIKAGATVTVADLQGPGKIVHIWFTIAHRVPSYSNQMTLRIYWDGETHPSVECPVGDFFGIGHGVDQAFSSLPITVTSNGRGRNCYWPMPFRKSAKITVTNDSDKPCGALYFYVDWQKHPSIPKDAAYFHAMYRQEFPCVMGRNYLLADIEGCGHYVGTIQSVYHISSGWYGEGDDFFFIDGAKEPQLRGTGTEDYFCDGWGLRQMSNLFYGAPLWEGGNTGDRGTAFRFHIPDPVVFNKSLRVEIEHKGSQKFPDGAGSGFIERDDLMSSVAFWYQVEPHKSWPALPAGKDRLPFHETVLVMGADNVDAARASSPTPEVQKVAHATAGKHLWFRPEAAKAWIEVPFHLENDVAGIPSLAMTHAKDYGSYRVKLDGKDCGVMDFYDPLVTGKAHALKVRTIAAGDHVLRFECVGKNPQSIGYFFGFDALKIVQPVYMRPEGKDLRELQVKSGK